MIYIKNLTGDKITKEGQFFVQREDTKFIMETIGDFENIIIDDEALVIKQRVIFLHNKSDDVIPGVLKSIDL